MDKDGLESEVTTPIGGESLLLVSFEVIQKVLAFLAGWLVLDPFSLG